nr:peptidase C48, SUMO/sentrin/Ubl1 [Tanacetum cinerariifolium]
MKLEGLEQRHANGPFIAEWEAEYSHLGKPTPPAIALQISGTHEADFMFKLNFVTLFGSTMGTLENDLYIISHIPAIRSWNTLMMRKRIMMETRQKCLGNLEHHEEFDPEEEQTDLTKTVAESLFEIQKEAKRKKKQEQLEKKTKLQAEKKEKEEDKKMQEEEFQRRAQEIMQKKVVNVKHIHLSACQGLGNYARFCTVRQMRRDDAYRQTQLLIARKKEQASTSGTQTNTDGSGEVHNYKNCYDNEIFNMFTQEEQYTELLEPITEPYPIQQNNSNVISVESSMEHNGGTVEQHPATVKETRAYFESLYNNLAT